MTPLWCQPTILYIPVLPMSCGRYTTTFGTSMKTTTPVTIRSLERQSKFLYQNISQDYPEFTEVLHKFIRGSVLQSTEVMGKKRRPSWEPVPNWGGAFCVATAVDTSKIRRRDCEVASTSEISSCNLSLHVVFLHCISSASPYLFCALRHADIYFPPHHYLHPTTRCLPHHCFLAASLLQSRFISSVKSPPFHQWPARPRSHAFLGIIRSLEGSICLSTRSMTSWSSRP
jgi:hypothetical protein